MKGIVAMIDVLGVSHYSIEECEHYLTEQKILFEGLEQIKGASLRSVHEMYYVSKNKDAILNERHNAIYGDTIVICWPLNTAYSTDHFNKINAIVFELRRILTWGLEHQLLLRGCVSVGDYVFDDHSVLGPAIFDAHNWYESTDWFGIIFSPNARLWLEYVIEQEKRKGNLYLKENEKKIVPYSVPLNHRMKDIKNKEFLTVAWPYWYYYESQNLYKIMDPERIEETPKESFLHDLLKIPTSKDGETKINNSKIFFEWYSKKYPFEGSTTPNDSEPL